MTACAAPVALAALLSGGSPTAQRPTGSELEQAAGRRFLSAEQFYAGGRHAQALRDFEAILDAMAETRYADDAALRIARHRFEVEGNPTTAEAMVDRLLREFPTGDAVPGAHYLRGEMAAAAVPPRLADARAEFERALSSAGPAGSPWSFAALFGIARVSWLQMDDDGAAGALLAALHETPPPAAGSVAPREARFLLACALARLGNAGAALREIAALRADLLEAQFRGGGDPDGTAFELAEAAGDLATLIGRFAGRGGPEWRLLGALSPPRRLDEPIRVRAAEGRLHVLDRDTDELQTFSREGEFLGAIGVDGPRDLAFTDPASSPGGAPLSLIAADDAFLLGGNLLRMGVPTGGRGRPLDRMRAVAAAPEGFWVFDDREKGVFAFDLSGNPLGRVPHGRLDSVRRIARHPGGHLVVIEEDQGVLAFDANGTRIFQIRPDAGLPEPVDLAFDSLGHLHVLDREVPALAVFDASFRPVSTFRGSDWSGGAVREPVSLDLGPDGALFVLDDATRAVAVLE